MDMVGFTDSTATATFIQSAPMISREDKQYINELLEKMSEGDKKNEVIEKLIYTFLPIMQIQDDKTKGVK